MTTRTVTGNIRSLTDSAVQTGTVTFEKIVTSTTGSTIHQSGVTTATTDSSGDFSIALAVPASGSYRYRMILPNGASFYFSIASGASVNVATLIEAETITDQDAVVELLDAYFPVDVDDLTTTTGTAAQRLRVAGGGGLEYRTTEQDLADLRDAGALATPDLGVTVQGYSAKTAAIAALTWAANSIIWLTGTGTASVQALASHIVTLLQSASEADARTAIGAASSSDLTTHTGLSTTAHAGLLPQDALFSQQSGDYTLQASDAGKNAEVSAAAAVTLPNGLDTGFQCVVMRTGSGAVTVAASTTLQKLTDGTGLETVASVSIRTAIVVTHRGSNVWLVTGDYS